MPRPRSRSPTRTAASRSAASRPRPGGDPAGQAGGDGVRADRLQDELSPVFVEDAMTLRRRQFLHLAAGAIALPAMPVAAQAQAFPAHPITMIVPVSAGGAMDTLARIVAQGMSASLGQPVVIENVTGASGAASASAVSPARRPTATRIVYGGLRHARRQPRDPDAALRRGRGFRAHRVDFGHAVADRRQEGPAGQRSAGA